MTETPDLRTLSGTATSPAWLVLDTARDQHFTGEIVFDATPETAVYLDDGVAYHAVRSGDDSLCDRLVEAGIVEPAQLVRGAVHVGGVNHLGRLFERDPSVDRDAVMVFVELATDAIVAELANSYTGSFRLTAYRHHESGIHRWFVAPGDASQLTPVGEVAQIDDSITSRLPGLPSDDRPMDPDDVRIEWDQPAVQPLAPPAPSSDDPQPLPALDASRMQAVLGEHDPAAAPLGAARDAETDEQPDWGRPVVVDATMPLLELDDFVVSTPAAAEGDEAVIAFDEDFQIVWPDGTQELPEPIDGDGDEATASADADADDVTEDDVHDGVDAPVLDVSQFDLPELELDAAAEAGVADDEPDRTADPAAGALPVLDAAPASEAVGDADGADETDEIDESDESDEIETSDAEDAIAAREPARSAPTGPQPIEDDRPQPAIVFTTDDGVPEPDTVEGGGGTLSFEMPPLVLSDDRTVPQEEQPDDVVDAVRRALAAIEAASESAARVPSLSIATPTDDETITHEGHDDSHQDDSHRDDSHQDADDTADDGSPSASTAPAATVAAETTTTPTTDAASVEDADPPAGLGAFAPPTPDMSAEAVYAARATDSTAGSSSGVASVVFVDDDADSDDTHTERAGALRRLIGSLRRK